MYKNKKVEEIVNQFQLSMQSIMISTYFTDNTTEIQQFETLIII